MLLLFFNVVLLASSVLLRTPALLSWEAFLGSGLVSGLLDTELLEPAAVGLAEEGAALAVEGAVLGGCLLVAGLLVTGGLVVVELGLALGEATLVVLIGGVGGPRMGAALATAPLGFNSGFLPTVSFLAMDVVLTGAVTLDE